MSKLNHLLLLAGCSVALLVCSIRPVKGMSVMSDVSAMSTGRLGKSGGAGSVDSVSHSVMKSRPVSLKITNRRGEEIRKSVFYYYLSSNRQPVLVKGGVVVIPDVVPVDTLFLLSDRYMGVMPLNGFDSLRIVVSGDEMFSVRTSEPMVRTGYGKVPESLISIPVSKVSVEDDVRMMVYKDLASYMTGRVAGVQIVTNPEGFYEVLIRGGSSLMASNAALIILDGVIVSDFETANQMVNILDLKSIEILKDGSSYGAQGVNGVVVITTKSGASR